MNGYSIATEVWFWLLILAIIAIIVVIIAVIAINVGNSNPTVPTWVWIVAVIAIILLIVAFIFYVIARYRYPMVVPDTVIVTDVAPHTHTVTTTTCSPQSKIVSLNVARDMNQPIDSLCPRGLVV
jgi:cytochrome bd-type quinol oxidase subunit 2